jgi:hypothetical protein
MECGILKTVYLREGLIYIVPEDGPGQRIALLQPLLGVLLYGMMDQEIGMLNRYFSVAGLPDMMGSCWADIIGKRNFFY